MEEETEKKEEFTTKDLMREILKLQIDVQRLEGKQDRQYNNIKKEMEEMKKEIKEEVQLAMKEEVKTMHREIENMKQERKEDSKENKTLKFQQKELEKAMHTMEKKMESLQEQQENLEVKEKEFQLRFRNIQEEENENIKKTIANIVAQLLQLNAEDTEVNIDRVFRIQSEYAKKHNVPRDVIVYFGKKSMRDEVLKENARKPSYYNGNKIAILKEHPKTVLERRRKYFFLTEELKRKKVRFKWERREGIMVTWEGNKHWLTTEAKARWFYDKYLTKESEGQKKNKEEENNGKDEPQETEQERLRKRPRELSPKGYKCFVDLAAACGKNDTELKKADGTEH
ncbi:uncharacterized protein PF3D7_1120000-like [Anolis sagrei]|uniref:uncharacterized protein PF3D7_1120000-like n=1 Tax=Anolis sagrei TaxID=38937 RepID=UPI003522AEEF